MINIKKLTYLLLFFLMPTCQVKNKECIESQEFLMEFTIEIPKKYPPKNLNLYMFFKLNDNSIIKLNSIELYDIYSRGYKDKFSFSDFVCSLFNEEIYLNRLFIKKNTHIYLITNQNKNVEMMDLKELTEKYCEKHDDSLILKPILNDDLKMIILYIFFRNKKYITFNDYQGYYILKNSLIPHISTSF